jgi:hypothetical protein
VPEKMSTAKIGTRDKHQFSRSVYSMFINGSPISIGWLFSNDSSGIYCLMLLLDKGAECPVTSGLDFQIGCSSYSSWSFNESHTVMTSNQTGFVTDLHRCYKFWCSICLRKQSEEVASNAGMWACGRGVVARLPGTGMCDTS